MKKDNERGIISLFVLLSMLFLLVFVFTIYEIIDNRYKNDEYKNDELSKLYSKNMNEIHNAKYSKEDEIIPIYNIDEFNNIGTGRYMQIKDKIYECSRSKTYLLKENIIIDLKEDVMVSNYMFNVYKLYDETFDIEVTGDNSLYFYYPNEKGNYWKNVVYQKFDNKNKEFVSKETVSENAFDIINSIENGGEYTFLIIWSNVDGSMSNIDISTQKKKPSSINDIEVFKTNRDSINTENGEYYILLNTEKNSI